MAGGEPVKVGVQLQRGHGERSRGHPRVLALDGMEIVAGRQFESSLRADRIVLVEAIKGDDSGKNVSVEPEKDVLVRLFPRSVSAVKNDEPVETITGELCIENTFERTFFFPVIPDELGGDRATGEQDDTRSRARPVRKLFSDHTLAVGIADTTGSHSSLHVSQIGMHDKAISIAAAFAWGLRPGHLDIGVLLGGKPLPRRNIFAVAQDLINCDPDLG